MRRHQHTLLLNILNICCKVYFDVRNIVALVRFKSVIYFSSSFFEEYTSSEIISELKALRHLLSYIEIAKELFVPR